MRTFLQQIYESMLDTFNVFTGEVLMGVSTSIARDKRHGMLHVMKKTGETVHHPFMVNNPDKLINPTFLAIRSLFIQAKKMELSPEFIEIRVNNVTKVYQQGKLLPVFIRNM